MVIILLSLVGIDEIKGAEKDVGWVDSIEKNGDVYKQTVSLYHFAPCHFHSYIFLRAAESLISDAYVNHVLSHLLLYLTDCYQNVDH